MSTKIFLSAAGLLSVLGLMGSAALLAADPQAPEPAALVATVPTPAPAPSGPPTVLLLSNGKVLQGEILKDESGYVLKHKVGVMHFPRRNVEMTFRSMEEVYDYKKSRCPENDPDERLKLATWCLEQQMKPEAKAHLAAILELSPENRRARAMLANLERSPGTTPPVDTEVIRTSVEVEAAPPAELNLNRLREEYARHPRSQEMPAIFDLETPMAVRRFQEYSRSVHPILQRQCARCHNEQFQGDFQMIQTRARRDLTNDLILRSNLDATLRIVNREDLAHSPLLSAAGMTHGAGGKPVLGGPNSPEYRVLANWVKSLKTGQADGPGAIPGPGAAPVPPGEGFAADRFGSVPDPAQPPTARDMKTTAPRPLATSPHSVLGPEGEEVATSPTPAGSLIPGSEVGTPRNPPPPSDFETPPLSGGPNPAKVVVRGKNVSPRATTPGATGAEKLIAGTPGTTTLPNGEVVPVVTKEMTQKSAEDEAAGKKRKFSPKALDGFLKTRPAPK